jgi:hypothetical protein
VVKQRSPSKHSELSKNDLASPTIKEVKEEEEDLSPVRSSKLIVTEKKILTQP